MKKISLLFVLIGMLVSFSCTSCKKTSGDVLQGTWKYVPGYSSSGEEEPDMTYIFDGHGEYTFISKYYDEENTSKGRYVIDGKFVHTYYSRQNLEGITIEGDDVLELNTDSNPPTLTADVYTTDGLHIKTLLFEKQ